VATGFNRNNGLLMGLGMTILRPVSRSPEKGAETVVWLATSPDVAVHAVAQARAGGANGKGGVAMNEKEILALEDKRFGAMQWIWETLANLVAARGYLCAGTNFRNGCLFGTSMLINGRLGRQLSLVLSGIAKAGGPVFC
jgi:hypothetical protein